MEGKGQSVEVKGCCVVCLGNLSCEGSWGGTGTCNWQHLSKFLVLLFPMLLFSAIPCQSQRGEKYSCVVLFLCQLKETKQKKCVPVKLKNWISSSPPALLSGAVGMPHFRGGKKKT